METLKGRERLTEALTEPQRPHPVLSALQFAAQTNEIPTDPEGVQGASLDVKTGRLMQAGKTDAWMVGGHPDAHGNRIAETTIPGREMTVGQALDHVQRVSRLTRGVPGHVGAGSWYSDQKDHLALDASTPVKDEETAKSLMKHRDEDAIFHLKSYTEVSNPDKKK